MLKLCLCILLLAGSATAGISFSKHFAARYRQLTLCDLFLSRLTLLLSEEKQTTPELFAHLAEQESLRELSFIEKTADSLKQNYHFPSIWRESLKSSEGKLALKKEDYQPLYGLSEVIGAYDAEDQVKSISLTRAMLQEPIRASLEESQTQGKLYRSLGVLLGIAAVILVI